MLWLTIPDGEFFDRENNEFVVVKGGTIQLEHSLVSMSKWESKWKKPLLSKESMSSVEEIIDYVKCMTITQNVKQELYLNLTESNITEINKYMDDSMTATTFSEDFLKKNGPKKLNKERITSELVYYWMISHNIPFECQKWHLNRLLTLIRVCSLKNQPDKKMSRSEIMARNKALNAQRKAKYNTKG